MKRQAIINISIDEKNRTKIGYVPTNITDYEVVGCLRLLLRKIEKSLDDR